MLAYRNLEDFVRPGVKTCHLAVDPYQGTVVKVERFDHDSSVIEKMAAMTEDAERTKHVTRRVLPTCQHDAQAQNLRQEGRLASLWPHRSRYSHTHDHRIGRHTCKHTHAAPSEHNH